MPSSKRFRCDSSGSDNSRLAQLVGSAVAGRSVIVQETERSSLRKHPGPVVQVRIVNFEIGTWVASCTGKAFGCLVGSCSRPRCQDWAPRSRLDRWSSGHVWPKTVALVGVVVGGADHAGEPRASREGAVWRSGGPHGEWVRVDWLHHRTDREGRATLVGPTCGSRRRSVVERRDALRTVYEASILPQS